MAWKGDDRAVPGRRTNRFRKLIAEHARSSLSAAAFASARGVPATTFSWWRHEVKRRDRLRGKAGARPRSNDAAAPTLLPVSVVGAVREEQAPVVEVVVRGRIVRVPRGTDLSWLRAVVEALETC
jgi:hypothetical protein